MSIDAGWIIFLGVVGGVALVIGARRRKRNDAGARQNRPNRQNRQNRPVAPVPTFRVVTLGLQGSGKTMLLTSIYRRLQTPGNRGYFLRVPHDQLIELNRWYREVAGSDGWPQGTVRGEMREFEFSVMTHVNDTAETVVKLGYLEYPGELLTDRDAPGSTAQQRLLDAVASADALIGIIDGFQVLQAYQGNNRGRATLEITLDAMIHSMLSVHTPIAFVITKWDLLDQLHADENTRLHIVRTMLMQAAGFRDLVTLHSKRRVIRLIPVTAVGHDFAVLDHGQVLKKPDGRFEPANVDVALASVVPDILEQVELSLDRTTREAILTEAQRRLRMGPREALHSLGTFVAERAGRILVNSVGGGLLADSGLMLFLDSRAEPGHDYRARLATLSAADRQAEEIVQARRRVVRELQSQVARLEGRLSMSRLSDGDTT